jgi:transglutaminase-like putative cysteine protease
VDGFTLFIFLVLIILPGLSIRSADWADHLKIVTTLGIIGTFSGALLAYSTFSTITAFLFNSVYGIFVLGLQLGNTLDPTIPWNEKIIILGSRFSTSIAVVLQGKTNQDSLFFVLLISTLFWIMGSFGIWLIFRKKSFWAAVLPPGALLLANHTIYLGEAKLGGYLISSIFLILILATRLDLWHRQIEWRKIRAQVPASLTFYFVRAGLIVTVVLILLAWGGPAFAQSEQVAQIWGLIALPFNGLSDRIADFLGGLRGAVAVSYDIYGQNLELRAGVEPGDFLVMEITPDKLPSQRGRFYWFSRAYNVYQDGNWTITIGESAKFDPEEGDLTIAGYIGREVIESTVAPRVPSIRGLYAPAQPIWTDRSGTVDFLQLPDGSVDVLRLMADRFLHDGDTYQARASVSVPTASELRRASAIYPAWVQENYLNVPEEITERTRDLAIEIASNLENPYDKAVAVTHWLRENLEYSRETIPPPIDAEYLDWLLFEYKVGFCNWYASAEIILLRILGIPSRLAVGYARGEYDAVERTFEVRGGDAHAWPEVFFPEYGWVEFEPTGNQSELIRPEEVLPSEANSPLDSSPDSQLDPGNLDTEVDPGFLDDSGLGGLGFIRDINTASLISGIVFLLAGIVFFLLLWMYIDPVTRMTTMIGIATGLERIGFRAPKIFLPIKTSTITPAGIIYSRWSMWLAKLGLQIGVDQTPSERALSFETAYPEASSFGWKIAKTYEGERFGGFAVEPSDIRAVWGDIRPLLWMAWLKKKFGLKV